MATDIEKASAELQELVAEVGFLDQLIEFGRRVLVQLGHGRFREEDRADARFT